MRPEELAARMWPGRRAEIEPLCGGITNRNFRVSVDGEAFVLRVPGHGSERLGIDRAAEAEAARAAAGLGIAPEVVGLVDGCLVTRFVAGETGRADPGEAGRLLRRLHGGPPIQGRFDAFRVVEDYAAAATALPPAYERARELAALVEERRRGAGLRPCHNDLLPANFVDDGARLWLVDWEYAGMGDPFFDLGNLAANHELDEAGEGELLAAYGSDDRDALALMRFMSDFREAMWGVVQQGLSDLDFDFAGYAQAHFDRLERMAASARFRRTLAT